MRHPIKALQPGSRVAVISPAGPVLPHLLSDGIELLKSWNLEVILDEDVYARRPYADYLAGSDDIRFQAIIRAYTDPDIEAIICSRGGYGTMRLLPLLPPTMIQENPKLLVGFSDITALHLYIAGKLGIRTLHGPVVKSMPLHKSDSHRSIDHLRSALFGTRDVPFTIDELITINPGIARGRVLGGNLTLVANLLASSYCPDLRDIILVVEDVGEQDYRLDRLFTSLRLAEKAHKLAGLVLGDFTNCEGCYIGADQMQGFLAKLVQDFQCPVVSNFPCGHGARNVAIPFGVEAQLNANAGTLTFFQDAVAA